MGHKHCINYFSSHCDKKYLTRRNVRKERGKRDSGSWFEITAWKAQEQFLAASACAAGYVARAGHFLQLDFFQPLARFHSLQSNATSWGTSILTREPIGYIQIQPLTIRYTAQVIYCYLAVKKEMSLFEISHQKSILVLTISIKKFFMWLSLEIPEN